MKIFILLISICLLSSCKSSERNLKEAPEGYTWQSVSSMDAYFLLPKNWFTKEEESNGTKAYFITKENIETNGRFKTGMSINCIPNMSKKINISVDKYACTFIDVLADKYTLIKKFKTDIGPFTRYACEIKGNNNGEEIHMYQLCVANNRTGTLYIIVAESPESEWNENSKILDKISTNCNLEGDF